MEVIFCIFRKSECVYERMKNYTQVQDRSYKLRCVSKRVQGSHSKFQSLDQLLPCFSFFSSRTYLLSLLSSNYSFSYFFSIRHRIKFVWTHCLTQARPTPRFVSASFLATLVLRASGKWVALKARPWSRGLIRRG